MKKEYKAFKVQLKKTGTQAKKTGLALFGEYKKIVKPRILPKKLGKKMGRSRSVLYTASFGKRL